MNGVVIAVSINALAFVGTLFTFVYRQGKLDATVEQIDKRLERIERIVNNKE